MAGLQVTLSQHAPIPLDVDLSCRPGEVLALVGPSGSGKSTVLRAIAGILRPANGLVLVDGETWLDTRNGIDRASHRRSAGMVFQSYALFPHMNALDNLISAMGHRPAREREARGRELMALMHLAGLEHRYPGELSGGQQQRVAVARALARDPKVLLLDEPFSAVDRNTRQRLYREIAQLRTLLKMPVVLVTHDLDEARMLANRMTVLHHGRTLQTGTTEEIMERPHSPEVARLVDVRNIFGGKIAGHDRTAQVTTISWEGRTLEAPFRPDIRPGSQISWAIPDGHIVLHRRERPARGSHENPVPGRIETVLAMGHVAHILLRPDHAPTWPLHFSVPTHVARRNRLADGVSAQVSLLTAGIHLMTAPWIAPENHE